MRGAEAEIQREDNFELLDRNCVCMISEAASVKWSSSWNGQNARKIKFKDVFQWCMVSWERCSRGQTEEWKIRFLVQESIGTRSVSVRERSATGMDRNRTPSQFGEISEHSLFFFIWESIGSEPNPFQKGAIVRNRINSISMSTIQFEAA